MNLSFRHYFWRWAKNLLGFFLFIALALTVLRVGFCLFFGDVKSLVLEPKLLRTAFFLGLRFDLVPLAYINIPPLLLMSIAYFIPGKRVVLITRVILVSFLLFGYTLLGWIYFFDYAFYSYFQDHLNILFFGFFEDDTLALIQTVWKNYNPLWLVVMAGVQYGIYRVLKLLFSIFEFDLSAKKVDFKVPLFCSAALTGLVFLARGNFTRLPISLEDAYISSNEFINEIPLNGIITLNRAIKIRSVFGKAQHDYLKSNGYADWKSAYRDAFGKDPGDDLLTSLQKRTPVNPLLKTRPPHVVMVVMESFGSYFNDLDGPEFQILGELKPHLNKGILYKNFLPAENGTIGSIVSVATSEPIRPGARFLSESEFMNVPLRGSSHIPFKEAGYETHFVYGGKLGWRDLGKYLGVQKYDHLWGADEMKEAMPELNNFSERDLGNEWGIFDEYLYTFIEEQLRTATKPQFYLVLTTSNHPPFEFPGSYQPLPLNLSKDFLSHLTVSKEIAMKRFLGLQYANQKMGEFINRLDGLSMGDRTIVALTGDHSYWIARGVGNEEEFRRFAVPFFIKAPKAYAPKTFDPERFGSHEDIFPTLYHLSLSDQSYIAIGENMLGEESHALNSSGLVANKYGAWHHKKFWKWKDPNSLVLEESAPNPELEKLERHGKGIVSITDLYLKEEKKNKQTAEGDHRRSTP